MATRQTYLLHVWNNGQGEYLMALIDDRSYGQCKLYFDYHKMIVGKTATVHVFFGDYDIRDNELIAMATKFMKGEYTKIDVNMYSFEVTESNGVDRTHPRQ